MAHRVLTALRVTLKCVSAGGAFGRTFHFDGTDANRIRFGPGMEVPLKGLHTSGGECTIHRSDAGFVLLNGCRQVPVRINGRPAEDLELLNPGDIIHVGDAAFLFETETCPDPSLQPRDLVEEQGLALFYEALKRLIHRFGVGPQREHLGTRR